MIQAGLQHELKCWHYCLRNDCDKPTFCNRIPAFDTPKRCDLHPVQKWAVRRPFDNDKSWDTWWWARTWHVACSRYGSWAQRRTAGYVAYEDKTLLRLSLNAEWRTEIWWSCVFCRNSVPDCNYIIEGSLPWSIHLPSRTEATNELYQRRSFVKMAMSMDNFRIYNGPPPKHITQKHHKTNPFSNCQFTFAISSDGLQNNAKSTSKRGNAPKCLTTRFGGCNLPLQVEDDLKSQGTVQVQYFENMPL